MTAGTYVVKEHNVVHELVKTDQGPQRGHPINFPAAEASWIPKTE